MPSHIKIIHAHEFIKVTAEGKLDFAESKKLLIEVATKSNAAPLDDYEIILDTRKAHSALTVTDLYNLVSELGKFRKVFSRKIAIICPPDRFNNLEFFALCAQNRGYLVGAFISFVEAWEWLSMEDDADQVEESCQSTSQKL
jgi:hypothetical protein